MVSFCSGGQGGSRPLLAAPRADGAGWGEAEGEGRSLAQEALLKLAPHHPQARRSPRDIFSDALFKGRGWPEASKSVKPGPPLALLLKLVSRGQNHPRASSSLP